MALEARKKWEHTPLKYVGCFMFVNHVLHLRKRADIFLAAADLCATKYRMDLNAATMLGQGKNIVQAEIDAACELIDFLRFNAHFALAQTNYKPISTKQAENSMIYRGLEGFVAAIAPFNFTAIGGNLASAPALMVCYFDGSFLPFISVFRAMLCFGSRLTLLYSAIMSFTTFLKKLVRVDFVLTSLLIYYQVCRQVSSHFCRLKGRHLAIQSPTARTWPRSTSQAPCPLSNICGERLPKSLIVMSHFRDLSANVAARTFTLFIRVPMRALS